MTAAEQVPDVPDLSVSELDLSTLACNCLLRAGIFTTGELVTWTARQLLELRSFGKTSLGDVERRLADHGLALTKPPARPESATRRPKQQVSAYAAALGQRLRTARARTGLSLGGVEEKSRGRWKAVVVGSWERGDRAMTPERLMELAEFHQCSASWLLTGEDGLSPDAPALLENVFAHLADQSREDLGELAQRAMQTAEYGRVLMGVSA